MTHWLKVRDVPVPGSAASETKMLEVAMTPKGEVLARFGGDTLPRRVEDNLANILGAERENAIHRLCALQAVMTQLGAAAAKAAEVGRIKIVSGLQSNIKPANS